MTEPTKLYYLYVKTDRTADWQLVQEIEAATHPEAFRKAMLALSPAHYDKPIRLEQKVADRGDRTGADA